MIIDCDSCLMDGTDVCADCVVTCLLSDGPAELSDQTMEAINVLAEVGLVPRLRLVPIPISRDEPDEEPKTHRVAGA